MGCIKEVGEGLSGLLEDVVWRGAGFNDDDNVDELPDELMDDVGEGRGGWLIAAFNTDEEGWGRFLDECVDRRRCCTAPAL